MSRQKEGEERTKRTKERATSDEIVCLAPTDFNWPLMSPISCVARERQALVFVAEYKGKDLYKMNSASRRPARSQAGWQTGILMRSNWLLVAGGWLLVTGPCYWLLVTGK